MRHSSGACSYEGGAYAFDQIVCSVTTSSDEWANEILLLDQRVVEGFVRRNETRIK